MKDTVKKILKSKLPELLNYNPAPKFKPRNRKAKNKYV